MFQKKKKSPACSKRDQVGLRNLLGKHIDKLVLGLKIRSDDPPDKNALSKEMTIYFNVLNPFMKNRV